MIEYGVHWRRKVFKTMRFGREILKKTLICVLVIFTCCEYLIYHMVISRCYWPTFNDKHSFRNGKFIDDTKTVRILILADPHLLGSKHGHWFDKLRREWQMKRSFQAAMSYLTPDAVVVLGDIFDEGMICSNEEWQYYVQHFWDMFSHPPHVRFYIVPGNHDIGFHRRMLYNSDLEKRFRKDFSVSGVSLSHFNGNTFILINSMAFEEDGCSICTEAEKDLQNIRNKLKCLHKDKITLNYLKQVCKNYPTVSDPIIFQHFPLYRSSEINCTGKDAPLLEIRSQPNWAGREVLTPSASELLLSSINPRLIFSGHTHHSCHVVHKGNIHEFTVPSFSWRNRNDPSFFMATINPNAASVQKCFLPEENTVILMYIFLGISSVFYILWTYLKHHRHCIQLYKIGIFQQREYVKIC